MDRDLEPGEERDIGGSQTGSMRSSPRQASLEFMANNDIDHGENTHVYGRQSVYSGGGRHSYEWPPSDQTHALSREEALSQKLIGHFFKVRKKEIFMTITPTIATTNAAESTVKKELVISFAGLQRMRLRKLQANLANRVMTMRFKGEEPRDWEELLKEYTNAVRDYDFICSCVDRPDDPFILSSARELEAGILSNELSHIPENLRSAQDGGWDAIEFVRPERKDMFTRGELSQEARLKAFFERLGMAIFGGIFLIGPMWLMVLKPDRYTVLISTSVFVLAFAIVMAVALVKDTMVTVFSATAAYAAVLVVFVGTTTTPSSH